MAVFWTHVSEQDWLLQVAHAGWWPVHRGGRVWELERKDCGEDPLEQGHREIAEEHSEDAPAYAN